MAFCTEVSIGKRGTCSLAQRFARHVSLLTTRLSSPLWLGVFRNEPANMLGDTIEVRKQTRAIHTKLRDRPPYAGTFLAGDVYAKQLLGPRDLALLVRRMCREVRLFCRIPRTILQFTAAMAGSCLKTLPGPL